MMVMLLAFANLKRCRFAKAIPRNPERSRKDIPAEARDGTDAASFLSRRNGAAAERAGAFQTLWGKRALTYFLGLD
jgi:hypothetical protein